MPPRKTKPRARRAAPVSWPSLPQLDQRQLDLVGLALVAAGFFFGCLIYLSWDGGAAGTRAVNGLRTLGGAVHYGVPVALVGAGAILVLRPMLPTVRPFRAGGACLFAGLCLALAAGTLGLGPGGSSVHWDVEWMRPRGGALGEALYWGLSTALGTVGAHIAAVFLFLAAVLLLTGASVAGVVKATTTSVSATTRDMRAAVQRRRATEELAALETGEPRVSRATTESFWSGEERFPDLYEPTEVAPEPEPEAEPEVSEPAPRLAEDPETDEPGVTRAPVDPDKLTPQGRYRPEVTEAADFVWAVPDNAFLKRSSEEAAKPDTAGQEKVAAQLVEALGHFGVEA